MYPQAIEEFEKAAALEKDDPNSIASLGHAYAVTGNKGAALKTLDELNTLAKQNDVSQYQLALVYAGLGEKDQAFESLEKAKLERSTLLAYLKMDPGSTAFVRTLASKTSYAAWAFRPDGRVRRSEKACSFFKQS